MSNREASRIRSGDGQRAGTVVVTVGAAAVDELVRLAPFIDEHSEAFSTSTSWLLAAARHLSAQPVAVTIQDDDETVAFAALARTRRRGAHRFELLGGAFNDYAQFYAKDEHAARALATAIADKVVRRHKAWTLSFEQLPTDDVVLRELESRLSRATAGPGPAIPQIVGIGTDYLVSRNRRRKANNALNRIEGDGLSWEQLVIVEPAELERWLPTVIAVRRQRDHDCGRRSHLDDAANRSFFETVVRDACAAGRLALDLLLVSGRVAGYGIVLSDGDALRMLDGRMSTELERYRGATVCDLAALARATADPAVSTFDWLRGQTDAKFGNHVVHRAHLRATSHGWVQWVDVLDRTARDRVKAVLPDRLLQRMAGR